MIIQLHFNDNTIIGHQVIQVAFKNCAPASKYVAKLDWITINDTEDLDLVMTMHNLIKYSSNYSEQQEVYGFMPKIKQLILKLILQIIIILNLFNMRLNC